jgi:hypothetical protein
MNILGRKKEQQQLSDCLESKRPEFVAVYGRRRVGKTYLIREFFGNRFSFYATGVPDKKTKDQLAVFNDQLIRYGSQYVKPPKDWLEAFRRLREILESDNVYREPTSGKCVIFLDELPWMDTARSDFKMALDLFWNGWASGIQDIVLIVCGSATSWVINNLILDTGGFYNRVTRQIHLTPFSLLECEELVKSNGLMLNRRQIIELYMIFGGIPYYLNCLDKRISIPQNVDVIVLDANGPLHNEYDLLFHSLFKKAKKHIAIVEALAEKHNGMTRTELAKVSEIGDGEPLTKALSELEQCDFIRKYRNYSKEKSGYYFQLIDPFVLFYYKFVIREKLQTWMSFKDTGRYYAWRGLAFEVVCLNHTKQIKTTLGISGIESTEYSWKSAERKNGVQIDLMIDRRDDVINLCEMKFSDSKFTIDADYYRSLRKKAEVFLKETGCKKTILTTLISVEGMERNEYSEAVYVELTGDDLFL